MGALVWANRGIARAGKQTANVRSEPPMSHRSRFHDDSSTPTLKYSLAALLESGALAFFHHPFQEAPHRFYSIHQLSHLGELFLR
jgi:hypothetical protein